MLTIGRARWQRVHPSSVACAAVVPHALPVWSATMTQQLRPSSARAASLRALVDVADEPSPGVENVTVGAVFRLAHDHRPPSWAEATRDVPIPHRESERFRETD